MWDKHSIYIKYRNGYTNYNNARYNDASNYYLYKIDSYEDLLPESNDWFIKIKWKYFKLIDSNREVKNFKYVWETFDTIKISRSNSDNYGDNVDWYLVKMIHRVDQFNDHENLMHLWNNEEIFDKKYILVLPEQSAVTWMNLQIEEGILNNIEQLIWTWSEIFSLFSYNKTDEIINLIVTDIPRNWQYSEIYTLNFVDNTYLISSSSSNQVVAWPQIIADDEWPDPTIKLYRPATDKVVSEWISLEWFVWTNYILQVDWEDNVALDEIWIANELWERIVEEVNISRQTGYIEYSWLYFTWGQDLSYYIGWRDINWNQYVVNTHLVIKVPNIEITNILKWDQGLSFVNWKISYPWGNDPFGNLPQSNNISPENGSMVTIIAELDQDIDSGYVQFFRSRANDKWENITGVVSQNNIPYFIVEPDVTEIYWWYFDVGNDIWLYSTSGDMVATINPENWKITVMNEFAGNVSINLDYSSKRPVIKVLEWNTVIFWIIFSSIELVDLTLLPNEATIEPLNSESFGQFYWWQAIIKNWEAIMYISPTWQIYTDALIFGEYDFDEATNSVVYSFEDEEDWYLWSIKIRIKNLLEY